MTDKIGAYLAWKRMEQALSKEELAQKVGVVLRPGLRNGRAGKDCLVSFSWSCCAMYWAAR